MQSDCINLTILENSHISKYENNDWVRSGVDGIVIDTEGHTQFFPNDGEANLEEGYCNENERDPE